MSNRHTCNYGSRSDCPGCRAQERESIRFASIPDVTDGETMLTIRKPGTWFDSPDYVAFIGGSGVGRVKKLADAKQLLLSEAIDYCERRVAEAMRTKEHYEHQLERLRRDGLGKPLKGAKR